MTDEQLFWATGVDNSQLKSDTKAALDIFKNLSASVAKELDKISASYDKMIDKSKVKFGNPVDPQMYAEIRKQIADLGKVIDSEVAKLSNFSYTYDKSMQRIRSSASNIQNVQASDPLAPTIRNIRSSVKEADTQIGYLERIFKRGIAYMAVYGSIGGLSNFVKQLVEVKGQFDQLKVTIDSFAGAKIGKQVFQEMTDFAVRSPFSLMDITQSTKQLLSYGFAAKGVVNDIKMVSDVAAGSGQSIKDIAYLYGTSLTQGRLYARDLFQFANRGVPIYQALSQTMGVSTQKLMDMVKAGKVGFPQLQTALETLTGIGGRYYGLSDKIAETSYGKLSNLKDRWMVTLNEIGSQNEGIINSSIDMTSSLIEHWRAVGNTIEGLIVTLGTYKAAQGMVAASQGMKENAYNTAFGNAAQPYLTSTDKELLAKEGLIQGSREYTAAVKAEMDANIAKSTATIAALEKEIEMNAQLLEEKLILLEDSKKNVIAKEAEVAAAIQSGDAAGASAAQVALETASKEANTIQTEVNTTQKTLNNAETALTATIAERDAAAMAVDTIAKEANATATGFLTVMTENLKKAWQAMTVWMAENPYTAAAAAIALLGFAVYKLYEYIQEQDNADKKWDDTQKKLEDTTAQRKRSISDLVDLIKRETTSNYEREQSMRKLQNLMPTVFSNMKVQQLLQKSGLDLQKQINEEAEKEQRIQTRIADFQANRSVIEAKKNLDTAKDALKKVSAGGSMFGIAGVAAQTGAAVAEQEAQREYDNAVAYRKKTFQAVVDANVSMRKAVVQQQNPTKDYDYWSKRAKDLREQREALPTSMVGSYQWNKLQSEELQAEKKVQLYSPATTIESKEEAQKRKEEAARQKAQRQQEQRNRIQSETNERKNQIKQNTDEIIAYEASAEEDRQKAYADSMQEGYLKDKYVIEEAYNKKMNDIEKEKAKILKLAQSNERLNFRNQYPKNDAVFTPTIKTYEDIPQEYKKGINDATSAAELERSSKEKMLQTNLLKSYNDYTYQKLEIDRKYYADRQALLDMQKDYQPGTKEYSSISARLAQNEKKRVGEQANLSYKEFKESPVSQQAYEDLSKVSVEGLNRLLVMLKRYKQTATEALDPTSVKTYTEEIDKIFAELAKKDPFTQIRIKLKELKEANKEYSESLVELSSAREEYMRVMSEESSKPIQVEAGVDTSGKTSITSKTTSNTDRVTTATNKYTTALNKNAIASSNVKGKQTELGIAQSTVNTAISKLGSAVSGVGDAIGGTLGQTISAIGSIGSFVSTAVDGITTVAKSGASAMQIVEDATIILGIISSAIQIVEKVASLFTKESTYEKLEKQLAALNKTLENTISLYEKLLEDVSGSEALTTGKAEIASVEKEIENYRELAKAKINSTSSGHSIQHEYGSVSDIQDTLNQGFTTSQIDQNSQDLYTFYTALKNVYGISINRISDLTSLTSEQLKYLEENYPEAWSRLDSTVQTDLEAIIDKSDSIKDLWNEIYEAATGVNWDDLKNGLDDLLLSTDTTMSDISDNFETYMRKAILNLVKTNYLSDALESWYAEFANDMGDNTLSAEEAEKLRQEYEDIYTTAQDKIDALLNAADISKSDSSSNTIKSSIASITEDQANVLTAQFSAIRLNVSDIKVSLYDYINKLDLVATDISQIREYTANLVSMKSILDEIITKGVIAR